MAPLLLTAFLLYAGLTKSSPFQPRAFNENENLVLANCGVGNVPDHPTWSTSFKAFYFKGNVWADLQRKTALHPDMIADIPRSSYSGDYPWQNNIAKFRFPNNDQFTVWLGPGKADEVKESNGWAWHEYDLNILKCFPYHKNNVAQLSDGTFCHSAVVCNHRVSTGPWPQLDVAVGVSRKHIDFGRSYNVIDEIFSLIPLKEDAQVCTPGAIPIPRSDCSIEFSCTGSADGLKTLPALRNALYDIARDSQYVSNWKDTKTVCKPCRINEGELCIPECNEITVDKTRVPTALEMYIRDEEEHELGHLTYSITCKEPLFCRVCSGLAIAPAFTSALAAGMSWALLTIKASCIGACGV
jgi:hypothetical protein